GCPQGKCGLSVQDVSVVGVPSSEDPHEVGKSPIAGTLAPPLLMQAFTPFGPCALVRILPRIRLPAGLPYHSPNRRKLIHEALSSIRSSFFSLGDRECPWLPQTAHHTQCRLWHSTGYLPTTHLEVHGELPR